MPVREQGVKICDKRFVDPVTDSGVRLPSDLWHPRVHEAGRMTLDADWTYRGVRSPFWRAYWNAAPGAAVRCGRVRIELGPDRVVVIPAFTEYDCEPAEGVDHVWVHFSADAPAMPLVPRAVMPDETDLAVWRGLGDRVDSEASPRRLADHALAALHLVWSRLPADEGAPPSTRLAAWMRWTRERLDDPPHLEEMARSAGMGRRTFLRWFREETGRTPADFLMELRIAEACRLLRYSDTSIDHIAEASGFSDRHHFSRVFKQRAGTSPAAWRRREAEC